MLDRHGILSELHAGISREWASGFSQLRRIPSTYVRKFIDYSTRLDRAESEAFTAALADGALRRLFLDSNAPPLYESNAAYRKYVDASWHMTGRRYSSVRALRGTLSLANAEPAPPPTRPRRPRMAMAKPPPFTLMSPEVRKWVSAIQPVTSTDIRKQVKQALSQVISPLKVSHPTGHFWDYSGELQGTPLLVSIDYSCRSHQLEYWVSIRNERTGLWGSNLERLMGLTSAHWDLLEGANLDQSVGLLCEHIAYCAGFLQRLPPCPEQADSAPSIYDHRTTEDA
jgi:hypothetical protein